MNNNTIINTVTINDINDLSYTLHSITNKGQYMTFDQYTKFVTSIKIDVTNCQKDYDFINASKDAFMKSGGRFLNLRIDDRKFPNVSIIVHSLNGKLNDAQKASLNNFIKKLKLSNPILGYITIGHCYITD